MTPQLVQGTRDCGFFLHSPVARKLIPEVVEPAGQEIAERTRKEAKSFITRASLRRVISPLPNCINITKSGNHYLKVLLTQLRLKTLGFLLNLLFNNFFPQKVYIKELGSPMAHHHFVMVPIYLSQSSYTICRLNKVENSGSGLSVLIPYIQSGGNRVFHMC